MLEIQTVLTHVEYKLDYYKNKIKKHSPSSQLHHLYLGHAEAYEDAKGQLETVKQYMKEQGRWEK
jgi:hypothetical protein